MLVFIHRRVYLPVLKTPKLVVMIKVLKVICSITANCSLTFSFYFADPPRGVVAIWNFQLSSGAAKEKKGGLTMGFFPQSVVDAKKTTKKQLKGGIDAHKKGCNICLLNEKGEKVKVKRISTGYESFDKFFSPLLKEYDVEVAIEVGNLVFVICDNLSFLKVDSYIGNPLKNRMIADSCQKTDKRDANTLAFQLCKGMLPPVRIMLLILSVSFAALSTIVIN